MRHSHFLTFGLPLSLLASPYAAAALNFTISNGQIFTPGPAVLDAPQPGTPLGGDTLHVALDVSANGKLPLPEQLAADSPSRIWNVTIFLYSYAAGRNFTVANGTATPSLNPEFNATLGDVMAQEPGSTVKHVNWQWPDCLAGDGQPKDGEDSDRGAYNISIRQNFRLNGKDHYTIFDVPISVTNSIPDGLFRPSCDELDNPLLSPEEIDAPAANSAGILFAPGDATQVDAKSGSGSDGKDGLGSESGAAAGRGGVAAGWWLGAAAGVVAAVML